jgi:hypothetical protein
MLDEGKQASETTPRTRKPLSDLAFGDDWETPSDLLA